MVPQVTFVLSPGSSHFEQEFSVRSRVAAEIIKMKLLILFIILVFSLLFLFTNCSNLSITASKKEKIFVNAVLPYLLHLNDDRKHK
jgi:hypothetical protein